LSPPEYYCIPVSGLYRHLGHKSGLYRHLGHESAILRFLLLRFLTICSVTKLFHRETLYCPAGTIASRQSENPRKERFSIAQNLSQARHDNVHRRRIARTEHAETERQRASDDSQSHQCFLAMCARSVCSQCLLAGCAHSEQTLRANSVQD
jgi:hypothetical protein